MFNWFPNQIVVQMTVDNLIDCMDKQSLYVKQVDFTACLYFLIRPSEPKALETRKNRENSRDGMNASQY